MENNKKELVIVQRFKKQEIVIYSVILFLTILAWFSIMDKAAYSMNIESLQNATGVFAAIKLIDALITFVQNVPIIGSLLEPYNDFLDRISWVMLISLVSLGLQKIIIISLQSFIVNAIITLNVVIIVANKFFSFLNEQWTKKLFKLVIVLLLIRFIIPFMTFMITSIETNAIKTQIDMSQDRTEKLQREILNIQNLLQENEDAEQKKVKQLDLMKQNIEKLEKKIIEEENQIDIITSKSPKQFGIFNGELSEGQKNEIEKHEKSIIDFQSEITQIENKIDQSDSWFDFASMQAKIKTATANLNTMVMNMFDIFVTLVVIFLFKTVVFPLLFLWGIIRLVDGAFSTNFMTLMEYKR